MTMHTYIPRDICPSEIRFDIDGGILKKVYFEGGCSGNLQALSKLVEGREVGAVLATLRGIDCDGKGTSCADQLAKALEKAVCHGE